MMKDVETWEDLCKKDPLLYEYFLWENTEEGKKETSRQFTNLLILGETDIRVPDKFKILLSNAKNI